MAGIPAQAVSIQCPNCRTPFQATVFSLIDAGQHPELKQYLLSGRVNVAVCPSCGMGGMLATPLAYHDPDKQLFLILVPQELELKPEEIERYIGDMTRMVMAENSGPAPKGYLLTPRRFFTLQSLVDSILEADGVSKEALVAQRKRVELISQLAEAYEAERQGEPHEPGLEQLAEQHKAELDYEFFLVLSALLEAAQNEGQAESTGLLQGLRERLGELTGFDAVQAGLEDPNQGEVLQALLDASDEQLSNVIAEYRPSIDYEIYQQLAERIEQAEQAGDQQTAQQLDQRRRRILELSEQMDREAQALFEAAADLLRQTVESSEPQAILRQNREQLGEAFMLVINANVAAAQRAGNAALVEQLQQIQQLAVQTIEEAMTPEDRVINQLMGAETAQEAKNLLRANMGMVTTAFVKRVNELADQLEQSGHADQVERLRQISREAASLLF